jgi:hypothetical protein
VDAHAFITKKRQKERDEMKKTQPVCETQLGFRVSCREG